jgi:hypothetical protein
MVKITKTLTPLLLMSLLAATIAGTAIQAAWAEVLLDDDSREWKGDSSGYNSPDGVWTVVHPGQGYAAVDKVDNEKILILRPEIGDNDRHSTLVTAHDVDWKGIHGKMEVRLDKQSDDPESWDSFWAQLAYVDKTTQINFLIKTDDGGWMVSKRDHDHEGQDLHEVLAQGNSIPEADKGHWYKVEWWIAPNPDTDDLHIKLKVDGDVLVDKDDNGHWDRDGHKGDGTSSFFLKADKTFGAYSEKSYTSWKNISVNELDELD